MRVLLSLFHDVPAGEQQPLDAGLSALDVLCGLPEIGRGMAQAFGLALVLFGVERQALEARFHA
jgi:hypothetical protein